MFFLTDSYRISRWSYLQIYGYIVVHVNVHIHVYVDALVYFCKKKKFEELNIDFREYENLERPFHKLKQILKPKIMLQRDIFLLTDKS